MYGFWYFSVPICLRGTFPFGLENWPLINVLSSLNIFSPTGRHTANLLLRTSCFSLPETKVNKDSKGSKRSGHRHTSGEEKMASANGSMVGDDGFLMGWSIIGVSVLNNRDQPAARIEVVY